LVEMHFASEDRIIQQGEPGNMCHGSHGMPWAAMGVEVAGWLFGGKIVGWGTGRFLNAEL
jgi:hypothetical protein